MQELKPVVEWLQESNPRISAQQARKEALDKYRVNSIIRNKSYSRDTQESKLDFVDRIVIMSL